MKKILAMLLVLCTLVCLTACDGGGVATGDMTGGDREVVLRFSYYAGGYGDAWLKAIAEDYLTVQDKVGIELIPSYDNNSAIADVQSGSASSDLYQVEMGVFGNADVLLDLSDVYNSAAYGEETLIKDKIGTEWVEFYNEDGKWYQVPNTKMNGWNWVYNKTVLDTVYGEGNYTMPRTTNELFAFGDDLFNNHSTFLMVSAFGDVQGGDYTHYLGQVWFAQMLGKERFEQYYNGHYYDEASGTYKLSEGSPIVVQQNKAAIEATYKVIHTMSVKENHYMFSQSDSLNYKQADQAFYGGYINNGVPVNIAMMYTGAWLETEVADLLEDGIITQQDARAMKMPVISDIIQRTPSIKDDAALSAVVAYVDGEGELPAGVTEADVAIVREARSLVCENVCRSMVVPSNTQHPEEVKDFLRYLASDRAQKISAQNANGLSQLPFGYTPTEENCGMDFTPYVESVYAIKKDAVILDVSNLDKPFYQVSALDWYYDINGDITKALFAGRGADPSEIYQNTYDYYNTKQWQTYIDAYKTMVGE